MTNKNIWPIEMGESLVNDKFWPKHFDKHLAWQHLAVQMSVTISTMYNVFLSFLHCSSCLSDATTANNVCCCH